MLLQAEFDLNSLQIQMYSGSFKEVLKQTMLSQEVLFRKQVLELHRLYGVQRILMQKFGFKEFDRCSFKKSGIEQTFLPCTNSARYDPMAKETEVSAISMLEKRLGKNYKLQRRPLDLQLPADQFISIDRPDLEELNLSLNIGMGCREKEGFKETFLSKKSHILSAEVIDLEDSIDGDAENEPSLNFNFDAPTINTDFENSHSQISSDNLSIKNEHFESYAAGYLDLNEAQHDDSSCHSNDPFVTHRSTSSSSPDFKGVVGKIQQADYSSPIWVREKNNSSIESSTLEQDANLDITDFGSRNERIETHTTESKFMGTDASEMDPLCDEAPVEPTINFSKDFSNFSDDESKKVEAVIDLPVSIINDKNCVPPANRHNQYYNTHKGLHVTETAISTEQEHRSSDSTESEQDDESSEMRLLIQNAAESLVCMSLTDSICTHDCNSKIASYHMEKSQVEQPQYSSDSFERSVLKQSENTEDEYSVSSKPSEVTDMENKDYGLKLRRGRRLKDFQKEILPSLSSLSRHEICEDINILDAVLRSREYRKIRAKMSDGHKWCAPMRSKRSRLNNVRRRIIL